MEARELQKTKDRNRTWNRGKTITEGTKGKPTWNRGKIITEGKKTESQSGIEARSLQKPTRNQGTTIPE